MGKKDLHTHRGGRFEKKRKRTMEKKRGSKAPRDWFVRHDRLEALVVRDDLSCFLKYLLRSDARLAHTRSLFEKKKVV